VEAEAAQGGPTRSRATSRWRTSSRAPCGGDAEEDEGYELDVSAEMASADEYLARLDRLAAGDG